MCINIYSPSFDNFDTDKFVSDWVKSPVYLRHLNRHNSSRTETHEEPEEKFFFTRAKQNLKKRQDYFLSMCYFFLSWMTCGYF